MPVRSKCTNSTLVTSPSVFRIPLRKGIVHFQPLYLVCVYSSRRPAYEEKYRVCNAPERSLLHVRPWVDCLKSVSIKVLSLCCHCQPRQTTDERRSEPFPGIHVSQRAVQKRAQVEWSYLHHIRGHVQIRKILHQEVITRTSFHRSRQVKV
jgi:hypothetical protein